MDEKQPGAETGVDASIDASVWQRFLHHWRPVRNVNIEHEQSLSGVERLAIWITDHIGTMGFFFIILTWTVLWLSWNFLAPKHLQFDPPMAFVFWLFISNMIQILLMPLIMIGQNLQGRHAEIRAENDFDVNVRSEKQITVLLLMLQQQQAMLNNVMDHLGIESPPQIENLRSPPEENLSEET